MSYADEMTKSVAYPTPDAGPGPITAGLKELERVVEGIDGALGDLRGRLAPILDQRDTDEPPPVPTEVRRSPSCEVGLNIEEAVRRLRFIRSHLVELSRRVEL